VHPPPSCRTLGPQCLGIPVTLRIGTLDKGPASCDHEATWLLGHTEHITFRDLRARDRDLLVDAVLHVRCRFLQRQGDLGACRAHGFTGPAPSPPASPVQPRRLGGDAFLAVSEGAQRTLTLPFPPRSLPVLEVDPLDSENPCSIAPCTTADHRRGSACCRDLQVEILCDQGDTHLEALVRSRQSPYLCKISRESPQALEAEMISACDYLDDPRENCTLHGRQRADGRTAKPDLCSEWPDDGKGLHPGCLWYTPPARKAAKRQ
jgi:hypothetical protein